MEIIGTETVLVINVTLSKAGMICFLCVAVGAAKNFTPRGNLCKAVSLRQGFTVIDFQPQSRWKRCSTSSYATAAKSTVNKNQRRLGIRKQKFETEETSTSTLGFCFLRTNILESNVGSANEENLSKK